MENNKDNINYIVENIKLEESMKEKKNNTDDNTVSNNSINSNIVNKKKIKEEEIEEMEDIDILNDNNIFNIIKDEKKLLKWKDLELESKIEKIKSYILINHLDFPDDLYNRIIDLLKKNKINFKKYIVFNKYTKNIDNMPIINFNTISKIYSLNYNNKKKVKKVKITF